MEPNTKSRGLALNLSWTWMLVKKQEEQDKWHTFIWCVTVKRRPVSAVTKIQG
jgi:hypothetical protein